MSIDLRLRYRAWGCAALLVIIQHCCFAQITWRRTYGGFGSDEAHCVRQTSDGGYIVVGSTGSFGSGGGDVYALRLDPYGEPIWSRTYGDMGVDQGIACHELSDGFIIGGSTSMGAYGGYDMLLIRTNGAGEVLWSKTYGTPEWDICNDLEALTDGYVLGGISYGDGFPVGAAYLIKTDLSGDTLWTSSWGGAMRTECNGIAATADQGFAIAGTMATPDGTDDGFITKYDSDGNLDWTSPVGGDSTDYLSSVQETLDGDLVGCGATHSLNPTLQIYLVSLDAEGGFNWERDIGSVADAAGTEVRLSHDGGFVFTGYNTLNLGERDMILTLTDGAGWFQMGNNFGDGEPADGYSIDPTDDGGYVVAGWAENYGPGPRAMYVVKTDSLVQTDSLPVVSYLDPLGLQDFELILAGTIFPNPITQGGTLHIAGLAIGGACELSLTDMLGHELLRKVLTPPEATLDLGGLSRGAYAVRIFQKGGAPVVKVLLVQ